MFRKVSFASFCVLRALPENRQLREACAEKAKRNRELADLNKKKKKRKEKEGHTAYGFDSRLALGGVCSGQNRMGAAFSNRTILPLVER